MVLQVCMCTCMQFSGFKLVCFRMAFRIGLYVILSPSIYVVFTFTFIFLIFVKGGKGYEILLLYLRALSF